MSPFKREFDDNGNSVFKILGIPVGSYFAPIIGTMLIASIVWLFQLEAKVTNLLTTVEPKGYIRLESEVKRIKEIQDQVVSGQTSPQQLLRSSVDRALNDISDLNKRCGEVNRQLSEIQREIDKLKIEKKVERYR